MLPRPSAKLWPTATEPKRSPASPLSVMPIWPRAETPSKLRLRMKLTTPETPSAPYTADAPPVSTSTRSIRSVGIELMSTAALFGSPAT